MTDLPKEHNPAADLRVGMALGQYEIIAKLGGGSMGVVYSAKDTKLGRLVALKFLPAGWSHDETAKQRFIREAQAASATEHRNICTIHSIESTSDGQLFIVMAYYKGPTLKQKLEAGPMALGEALEVAAQIAEGLAKVHGQGVVHRDIKPGNLIITEDGVRILDFGLAKFADAAQLTMAGSVLGTVAYMSPEQAQGEEADARSDVWALGVVFYEMLAGRVPFRGSHAEATFQAIKHEPPPPLRRSGLDIPEAVEALVLWSLEKNPTRRVPSAHKLAHEIRLLQGRTGPIDLTASSPPLSSIAVLPFRDISPARDQDCFCEGLTEELISALTKVAGLRVAARASAFQFKDQARDLRDIGKSLNVATVLDGSVRKIGNRLRVTVELLNSADGYHLWSEQFDRDLEDVFAVQDEIATRIVGTLKGKFGTDETTRIVAAHTKDLDAYMSYLEGRYHWNKRTEHELKKSVAAFERAIGRDRDYAQAYAGLADALVTLGTYGALPPAEVTSRAIAAVEQALRIDPQLAEAYTCRGCLQAVYNWSWLSAEHDFERAIELSPGYPSSHHWYAINCLVPVGRFDEATKHLHRALELDPLSLAIRSSLGMKSYFAGRHEQALRELSKAVELDESFTLARLFRGRVYTALSRYDEAIGEIDAAIRLSGRSPDALAAFGHLRGVSGDVEGARNILAELGQLRQRRYVSPTILAQVHAGLGEKVEALDRLEEAPLEHAADLAWLRVHPAYASLHTEPRFVELLERIGLAG